MCDSSGRATVQVHGVGVGENSMLYHVQSEEREDLRAVLKTARGGRALPDDTLSAG